MSELTIAKLFELIPSAFQAEKAAGIDAAIQVHLDGVDGGDWVITIVDQTCKIDTGLIESPRLKLSAQTQDILDIVDGKLDPMRAFMLGKLKMHGDNALALKLLTIFKPDPELLK